MSEIKATRVGRAGIVTLNRPRALNAITHEMILQIAQSLQDFEEDPGCKVVILTSSTPGVFCAGGDLRKIRENVLSGNERKALSFFRDEYALINKISNYKILFVSLINGICMGGGVGLSVHGQYRVFSSESVFAMPETAIGFFPDVGASYILPRIGAAVGLWLALTSSSISGADAVRLGLGTHYVSSENMASLLDDLCHKECSVEKILSGKTVEPQDNECSLDISKIEQAFECSSLHELISNVRSRSDEFGRECFAKIMRMCPNSLEVTFDLLHENNRSSLRECLSRELLLAEQMIFESDFLEGVRAVLVEKTKKPLWTSRLASGYEN